MAPATEQLRTFRVWPWRARIAQDADAGFACDAGILRLCASAAGNYRRTMRERETRTNPPVRDPLAG